MRLPSGLQIPEDKVAALCLKWGIRRLEIFGSALTTEFAPTSDLDLLATFDNEDNLGLNFFAAATDFQNALARKIDLVSKEGLMQSPNKYRVRKILSSAVPIYDRA
jgi:predicted nucleotidyltransferase